MKSILITGCSSGIGLHTALLLKKRGFRVFATAKKAIDVEKLITQGLESVQLDVRDVVSMQHALAHILQQTGGTLDAVFNNAGYLHAGAIEDTTADMVRAQLETNVIGPWELIRLILPIMRKQGHGRIIQNSSILGVMTMPYYGAYNTSKFALEGFSNTLRQELRGTHIYVSIINPGPIVSKLRENSYTLYQDTLAKQTTSLHKKNYEKLEHSYFHPDKNQRTLMQHPDAVVKYVIHALESNHPHAHYFVGGAAKIMAVLKRILPDSWLDWVVAKISER